MWNSLYKSVAPIKIVHHGIIIPCQGDNSEIREPPVINNIAVPWHENGVGRLKRIRNVSLYNKIRERIFGRTPRVILFLDIGERINGLRLMVAAIVLGVIISSGVEAQDFYKGTRRHFKSKYKTQIAMAGHECAVLFRKRNSPKKVLVLKRIPKYKPQAEVDPPGFIRKEPELVANP